MTDSYLTFFFNIPNLTPLNLLTLFLLALFRIAPVIFLAPFLGGKIMPVTVRAGVAIILSFLFLPMIITTSPNRDIVFNLSFTLLAFKELFIGFMLGFLVTVPFFIAQSTGILIDYLRGSSIMQAQDPTTQSQSSTIGNLFNYLLIVLFFQIDGPFIFFDAFIKSYKMIPATGFISSKFFGINIPAWKTSLSILHSIVSIAIQLAAPALVAILMTEMFLGIANRLAPQVQIAFLGMSLKSLVGLFLLWAGWFFIFKQLSKETYEWLNLINNFVDKLVPYALK